MRSGRLPALMVLQVVLSQRDWPGLIKFFVIILVLVRFTVIGVILNGRRAARRDDPVGGIATA